MYNQPEFNCWKLGVLPGDKLGIRWIINYYNYGLLLGDKLGIQSIIIQKLIVGS